MEELSQEMKERFAAGKVQTLKEVKEEFTILQRNSVVPGGSELLYLIPSFPAPIARIDYAFDIQENALSLTYVWVSEDYARLGVATRMHDWLRAAYPTFPFVTGLSTEKGQSWLRKLGYERKPWGWRLGVLR